MSEQELILKTKEELTALAGDLFSKIKMLSETDKASSKRSGYFEDLQTVIRIINQRTS